MQRVTENLTTKMKKKTCSNSEKLRHACNSVEIAWTRRNIRPADETENNTQFYSINTVNAFEEEVWI